jgi:exodeoxyribonuclease VIII
VGADSIWAQGPLFDFAILENLYRQYGWPTPWQYWQIRDSRTLFGVHGDPRVKGKVGLHNALEDCVSQASAVQQVYNKLGLEKR